MSETPPEASSRPARPLRREDLLEAIAREEARLDRLEADRADARARLAALRSDLASLGTETASRAEPLMHASHTAPRTCPPRRIPEGPAHPIWDPFAG
jgi:hypothetical protein